MNALSLSRPLGRRGYFLACAGLLAAKLALDIAFIWALTGEVITPLTALNPWLTERVSGDKLQAPWLALALLDLPILWIGLRLSCRRAIDAGLHWIVGVLFVLPLIRYLVCVLLSVVPPQGGAVSDDVVERTQPTLMSAAAGAAAALAMMLIGVMLLNNYGGALFVGAPFALGIVTGFSFNRNGRRTGWATIWATQLALLLVGGALLAFALEGVVCLAMAYPLAGPVAALGGALGEHLATASAARAAHVSVMLLAWPLLCGAEMLQRPAPLREVATIVEIAAPPSAVWTEVIAFAELPPPHEWVFRLGIAHPQRARMEGSGPGAVRYCEFSTGPFVEPVTVWDEPTRLAFDVASTPPPMHEWSPYQTVHAPHLVDSLRSRRGEFHLVPLPNGGTRLEGRTWYEIEMFPQAYWGLWSDALIHAIHGRVLDQIKLRAETARSAGAAVS